ncbi:MAG: carbamoyltransferase [Candidatus Aenigmarchaeota archaeon]|nr:carbamoyltransferase [Candidatus Aenigmarchaeota archaeon]
MRILGISCFYHDSAAALIEDGKLVAAAQEERFTRKKHDTSFPKNAVEFCLKEAACMVKDIDYVAFYEKPLLKFDRLLQSCIDTFPWSLHAFCKSLPAYFTEKLRMQKVLKKQIGYKGEVLFAKHHQSHAASAFLCSPFTEAAILTVDGVGEWTTTSYGYGKNNSFELHKEIVFPHSLGLLYSAITGHLGFKINNDEYKVMGLAPYGKPVYADKLRKLIELKDDGSYSLDMSYFTYHYKMWMTSKKFEQELGPRRMKESKVEEHHQNLAASLQKVFENVLFKMLRHLHKELKSNNLVLAGGCALNSVANGKITRNTPFKNVWAQPAADDAGGALGAALWAYHCVLGNPRSFIMNHAYWGPEFSTEEVEQFLKMNNIIYKTLKDDELTAVTAKLIFDNNVIGWFQGRMEWGPRALGARSILSNPCNEKMKDIINAKVKHREMFRPFAPVISEEDVHEYFEIDKEDEKFMLFVYPIKPDKRKLIPAVTHVDGTGRLQTINRQQNSRYYGVIKEFEKLSRVPVLINTSFNIRGEPIVCTPKDAYRCMMGTGIDYLVIDKFLIARAENPKDMWDSESLAKD